MSGEMSGFHDTSARFETSLGAETLFDEDNNTAANKLDSVGLSRALNVSAGFSANFPENFPESNTASSDDETPAVIKSEPCPLCCVYYPMCLWEVKLFVVRGYCEPPPKTEGWSSLSSECLERLLDSWQSKCGKRDDLDR